MKVIEETNRPTLTTPAALARRWSVSPTLIYDMLNSGDLPAIRLGKLWRIRLADVEARERGGADPTAAEVSTN